MLRCAANLIVLLEKHLRAIGNVFVVCFLLSVFRLNRGLISHVRSSVPYV